MDPSAQPLQLNPSRLPQKNRPIVRLGPSHGDEKTKEETLSFFTTCRSLRSCRVGRMVIFAASMGVVTGNTSSIDEKKMETEGIAKQLRCVWLRYMCDGVGWGGVCSGCSGGTGRKKMIFSFSFIFLFFKFIIIQNYFLLFKSF